MRTFLKKRTLPINCIISIGRLWLFEMVGGRCLVTAISAMTCPVIRFLDTSLFHPRRDPHHFSASKLVYFQKVLVVRPKAGSQVVFQASEFWMKISQRVL